MTRLKDWLPFIAIALVCFSLGKSCQNVVEHSVPYIVKKKGGVSTPPAEPLSLGDKLLPHRPKEAKPETIIIHEFITDLPPERIVALDFEKGRLSFLTDQARAFKYRLPVETYAFSVRMTDYDPFVKYRRALWERRLIARIDYPFAVALHFDITLRRRLYLGAEASTSVSRVEVGYRLF